MRSSTMIKENMFITNYITTVHIITVKKHTKGGWYKQITAKEGMINRSLDRWYNYWNEKKHNEYDAQIKFESWTNADERMHKSQREPYLEDSRELADELYPTLIKVYHSSLWEFFDYIGYDHKDKKVGNTDSLIHIIKK
jgi:hypothetical protein